MNNLPVYIRQTSGKTRFLHMHKKRLMVMSIWMNHRIIPAQMVDA